MDIQNGKQMTPQQFFYKSFTNILLNYYAV